MKAWRHSHLDPFHLEVVFLFRYNNILIFTVIGYPNTNNFWRKLMQGLSYHDKIERRAADGHSVWLEATYMPIFDDANQNVIGVSKIAADITSRQQDVLHMANDLQETSEYLSAQSQIGKQDGEHVLENVKLIEQEST